MTVEKEGAGGAAVCWLNDRLGSTLRCTFVCRRDAFDRWPSKQSKPRILSVHIFCLIPAHCSKVRVCTCGRALEPAEEPETGGVDVVDGGFNILTAIDSFARLPFWEVY